MPPAVGDSSTSGRGTGGSSSAGKAGQQQQAAGGAAISEKVGAKDTSSISASVSSEKASTNKPASTPPGKDGAPKSVAASTSAKGSGGPMPSGEKGKAAQKPAGTSAACDVHLDASDSHIDLQIDRETKLKGTCMHTGGFQYLWKGVRTTHGIKGTGKYYFEVQVAPNPPTVVMRDTPANTQHVCRVGVSQPLTSLHLGESEESWGFGGTGKKSTARRFLDYGQSFGGQDVIGVIIDLDALTLAFTKNGQFLGIAYELPQRVRDTGLLPHIYVKNYNFQANFKENTKWFDPPGQGIRFIGDLKENELMVNPVEHPKSVSECEFIMMCGLPACGKTYWAERHCEKHASKAYLLLGTNAVIDQMRVMGLKRQRNYAGRWDELMSTANEVFNSLVAYAGSGAVPRNIIIDQTNVFKRARCRKVEPFRGWGTRRCVVMVTDDRTLQFRTQKREKEEGKMVPVEVVQNMKANFALPTFDEGFSVIDYVELPEAASRDEIRRINAEGRAFKRDNPHLHDRQPKPHIEVASNQEGYPGTEEQHPAKKQKGGPSWQGDMGGGPWGPPAQHPQAGAWGGGPPQGPPAPGWNGGGPAGGKSWQQAGAAWSGSNAGSNSGYGRDSSYGGYQGGGQQYAAGPQRQVYAQQQQQQQQQQQPYGSGYGGALYESGRGGGGYGAQHPHSGAGQQQQQWQQQQQQPQQWQQQQQQQHWQQQQPQQYGQHWQQQGQMSYGSPVGNGAYSGYAQQGGRY